MADELEEIEETEALEPDLDDLAEDEDLIKDAIDEDDPLVDDELADAVDDVDDEEETAVATKTSEAAEEDEEEEEAEEEAEDDDVEASLDVILKERLVVADQEDEDEEAPEVEDRSEPSVKVMPKQPDEFVCQSCFLVKHPSQLADPKRQLCRDCV